MILELLKLPTNAINYSALLALQQQALGSFILETVDSEFDWHNFALSGLCSCTPRDDFPAQLIHGWSQEDDKIIHIVANGYFNINWMGHDLRLLQLTYETSCSRNHYCWIVGKDETTVKSFFGEVSRWSTTIREEVYVFQEGFWQKDSALFKSIQSSRLESLILPPGLKDTIRNDAAGFFDSRDRYHKYNVPWKRGLMLLGPPGNGKTHMIQGLINDLKKPCLYVKSLKSRYENEDRSLREIFDKARKSAPCILILEDIDAMINSENRSFFLNELDGFRKNEGLLTIATTNHPEKLDPAIVDRPSRFDRKYHFELPAVAERTAYLRWWNHQLDAALVLSEEGIHSIAENTQGFSFAYLKELALASTMAWWNDPTKSMAETMAIQLVSLREQMTSTHHVHPTVDERA
jgi:hypothetical protein